jgi:hypothetical protein
VRLAIDEMHDEHSRERPLGTYLLLTASFNALAWSFAALLGAKRRAPLYDVCLLGTATHQISTIVTTDRVTRTLRTPFVEETPSGGEKPKSHGPKRALGELMTCPYCMAPWIAAGMTGLYFVSPNTTRAFSTIMSVAAISTFLSRGYAALKAKQKTLASDAPKRTTG